MPVYISLLRAINLGAKNKIRMGELSVLYEQLGLLGVQTYLQSGNVVFRAPAVGSAALTGRIEAAIQQQFGFPIAVLNLQSSTFQRIVEKNPFAGEGGGEPSLLHAVFLFERPEPGNLERLNLPQDTGDEYALGEHAIYLFCPNGFGRSKLAASLTERKLGVRATTRNWRTVLALEAMARQA